MKRLTGLIGAIVVALAAACFGNDGARQSDGSASTPSELMLLHADGIGEYTVGGEIDQVVEGIVELLGEPIEEQRIRCESGSDRIVFWRQLYVVANNDRFAGYNYKQSPFRPSGQTEDVYASDEPGASTVSFATREGLSLGDTVLRASKLYAGKFVIIESTLGPEWWVERDGDAAGPQPLLRGFAEGLSDEAAITSIGAGDICAFR